MSAAGKPSVRPGGGLRSLRGPDKAAALLLAMGRTAASQLLKKFEPDELKLLGRSAASLGAVSQAETEALVEEFAGNFLAGPNLVGTAAEVEKLLAGVLPPEQIAEIMGEVMGRPTENVWSKLAAAPDAVIIVYLENEHPQASAYVLSRLDPGTAARLLAQLPSALRNALMRRMLAARPVLDAARGVLETTMEAGLMAGSRNAGQGNKSHVRLADIMNKMDREQMEEMMASLSAVRPAEAAALKGLLFSFEDIVRLTPQGRMTLFDTVPAERVVLSLQGMPEDFREVVLSSLASRARRIVESELNGGGAASARDVNGARRAIADLALDLAAKGELDLAPPPDVAAAA